MGKRISHAMTAAPHSRICLLDYVFNKVILNGSLTGSTWGRTAERSKATEQSRFSVTVRIRPKNIIRRDQGSIVSGRRRY